MRRFSRGRAATDDEATPPATGTSEAAGDAAPDPRHPGDSRLPGGEGDASTSVLPAGSEVSQQGAPRAGGDGAGVRTDAAGAPAAGRTSAAAAAAAEAPGSSTAASAPAAGTTASSGTADAPDTTTAADTAAPDATPVAAGEPVPGRDLPAGVDLAELAAAPGDSVSRGRLRRRLRYLRHVRELLLRDLGGFYAEAHRSEPGPDVHRRLLDAKASRLATLDAEVRALEDRLAEPHAETLLREPGIGGTCPQCGELHGSDARFCSRCGGPLTGRAARDRATGNAPAGTTSPPGGALAPAAGPAADEDDRMTTASLWGRRRSSPPPESDEQTRAADLTQAVREPDARRDQSADDRTVDRGASAGRAAGAPAPGEGDRAPGGPAPGEGDPAAGDAGSAGPERPDGHGREPRP